MKNAPSWLLLGFSIASVVVLHQLTDKDIAWVKLARERDEANGACVPVNWQFMPYYPPEVGFYRPWKYEPPADAGRYQRHAGDERLDDALPVGDDMPLYPPVRDAGIKVHVLPGPVIRYARVIDREQDFGFTKHCKFMLVDAGNGGATAYGFQYDCEKDIFIYRVLQVPMDDGGWADVRQWGER